MENIRRHLEQRRKVLEDDIRFWGEKAVEAVDNGYMDYCLDMRGRSLERLEEAEWALRVLEESCLAQPTAMATNSADPTVDATGVKSR